VTAPPTDRPSASPPRSRPAPADRGGPAQPVPGAPRTRAVVVGGGFGGLAVAIRLLADGHDVTIVERRATVGGRASQIRDGGYTWDTGPSLITMPELFDELFRLGGSSLEAEVRLHELDPMYRIYWTDDERYFDFTTDVASLRRQMAAFNVFDAANLDRFLAATKRIHEEGILVAGRKPFLRAWDFAGLVPKMAGLDSIRFLGSYVAKYFRDPKIRQVYDFHSLFIGGDPDRVPAIYAAIAYLQVAGGTWYAEGGVYSLVEALARTVTRGGGRIVTGDGVARIVHRDGRATAVVTDSGLEIPADIVVNNGDVTARDRLLPDAPDRLPWRLRPLRTTMSAYLLYLGTNRRFDRLLHHSLIVGDDYRGFIRDVTRDRRMPTSFSVYLHAPTRTEPAMAPPGGDSIGILLPVPNLRSGDDWTRVEPALRDRLLDWLEGPGGLPGLRSSIVTEHSWTPLTFRDDLGATDGNAFAVEPTLQQSAYFRQPNRDRVVRNVYYVGGGTHPGAGLPGTLLTAEVTTNVIRGDTAARRR
jgi:phytoene desaturase